MVVSPGDRYYGEIPRQTVNLLGPDVQRIDTHQTIPVTCGGEARRSVPQGLRPLRVELRQFQVEEDLTVRAAEWVRPSDQQ